MLLTTLVMVMLGSALFAMVLGSALLARMRRRALPALPPLPKDLGPERAAALSARPVLAAMLLDERHQATALMELLLTGALTHVGLQGELGRNGDGPPMVYLGSDPGLDCDADARLLYEALLPAAVGRAVNLYAARMPYEAWEAKLRAELYELGYLLPLRPLSFRHRATRAMLLSLGITPVLLYTLYPPLQAALPWTTAIFLLIVVLNLGWDPTRRLTPLGRFVRAELLRYRAPGRTGALWLAAQRDFTGFMRVVPELEQSSTHPNCTPRRLYVQVGGFHFPRDRRIRR